MASSGAWPCYEFSMSLTRYRDLEWFQPPENHDPDDTGLQKAWLHRGSFFAHAIRLAPGYVIPPHRHDRDELMVVLAGSATLDSGAAVEPPDTLLLAANVAYGFTAGPEGMEFMVVRTGQAGLTITG